ncbi:MAG TPA: cyanophycinase [Gemmatimonadaceae bacterium]
MRITRVLSLLAFAPVVAVAQDATQAPAAPEGFNAPFRARPPGTGAVKVGPSRGTVVVVGGGSMGPEIYRTFIEAAGGPDALILVVPNAGGADSVSPNAGQAWRNNGARNVQVLFTKDRRVADSDSFTAPIRRAGGVWFEGGRQFRLVQDYGGTRTEREFMAVLERGGVLGGSSAGATILGDFMVRGAPSNNNTIMDYPGYQTAFGYLRGVAVDQHVVARSRLPDLADSIMTRYPDLLGISEDEGTAWVIRGDTGRIIGRSKAFVYNGRDPDDPGSPFLTLLPGDRYDLHARRIISRAADRSPVSLDLIKALFAKYENPSAGGATVLVAQDGDVFVDHAFGIPAQPRHMPRTTLPLFDIGDIAQVFTGICAQLPPPAARGRGANNNVGAGRGRGGPPPSPLQQCVTRVTQPVGAPRTSAPDSLRIHSNVDELYRLALGYESPATWRTPDQRRGWTADTYKGVERLAAYARPDGKRGAFVRVPSRKATIIILTNDATADAKAMSERILDELLAQR